MKYIATAKKYGSRVLAAATLATTGSVAFAATTAIDTTDIIAQIAIGATAAAAVGGAVLGVIALVSSIKLVRRGF